MKRIIILALNDSAATTITGPYDIFSLTGVLWDAGHGQKNAPRFEVKIVTSDGAPARCLYDLTIMPHHAMKDIRTADLILVSSVLDIKKTLSREGEIIDWLRDHYQAGAMLASVCTGSFVLAETGLLDGKIATTHWRTINEFRALYPRVHLKPEQLITDAGDIFCSGGFNSSIDLSSYLVQKICGREIAVQCAKSLVYDIGRNSQAPYTIFQFHRDHNDEAIIKAQKIIERHCNKAIDLDGLSKKCGIGRRSLERRFKAATGDTALGYLQRVRVEEAKRLLESSDKGIVEIGCSVGFDDSSYFRKVFIKHTSLRPKEYRAKFTNMTGFKAQKMAR